MYFIYLFILCYTSTLVPSVKSYVVLAANLNDFKSLAKKYVPNRNPAKQIKVMVLETGHKDSNRETSEDDELIERTAEYMEEEDDDSYEVMKPVYKYQLKNPPRISLLQPQDPSPKIRLDAPKLLTLDDLTDKLKHEILQEIINKNGDDNAQLNTQVNTALDQPLRVVVNKNVQNQPKLRVEDAVPMKVFKKEVQFEGTSEDAMNKNEQPQVHYLGQVQIPTQYLKKKPVNDVSYIKIDVPKKHRFVSPKKTGAGKNVRYFKQVLVPVESNQVVTDDVLQSSLVQQLMQQPILGQQSNIVTQSILEPQLSLTQQTAKLQLPLDQQPSIIQQMALMQQQIDRLNKIMQQNLEKNKQFDQSKPSITLEAPQQAVEASFEIVPKSNSEEEDVQETEESDSNEDKSLVEDDSLSEEITIEPTATETNTELVPTTVENEQFMEESEDVAGNEEDTQITTDTPEEAKETESKDEQEKTTVDEVSPIETILVKADNAVRLGEIPKKHTQEFGNPAAGEPIVEKTYNFNVPIKEPNQESLKALKLPADSARKVLLF